MKLDSWFVSLLLRRGWIVCLSNVFVKFWFCFKCLVLQISCCSEG